MLLTLTSLSDHVSMITTDLQKMFSVSLTAVWYWQSETKVKYVTEFGIVPYIKRILEKEYQNE